ncbi:hypothetical protein BDZ45DRAFT_744862 [Acephala macrosclerotiorum]|nr:hypothetical protein BDZ45DRAFT_744862 [Acephala macrosclerotiorum]
MSAGLANSNSNSNSNSQRLNLAPTDEEPAKVLSGAGGAPRSQIRDRKYFAEQSRQSDLTAPSPPPLLTSLTSSLTSLNSSIPRSGAARLSGT